MITKKWYPKRLYISQSIGDDQAKEDYAQIE